MCGAIVSIVSNSFFKKKLINKFTWMRVLMDYVLIAKSMIGRVEDVHVFRGVAIGISDHFLIETKVVLAKEWGNRVGGCRREVVKME